MSWTVSLFWTWDVVFRPSMNQPTAGDEWNIVATTNSGHSMATERLALQLPDPANRLPY